ncbi:putative endonuclease [Caldalkalibacillus uzonensis]|uniref:Endonuclease n=1 Tax=Caldalkalibacillus uzonensis TaxID=353224 RepID=A0ABU0CVL0_9BACI|nr:GIY-YIG nuclease family protein [Caldalkalibacillus uzonensis]MDQ0340453.1 putative endonuclease [Caldalkalibacillus uzonensis]
MPGCYCVYILRCRDGSLYTGYTNDLSRRLRAHREGKASKYTRSRLPVELVYYEQGESKSWALKREYEIKQLSRSAKEALLKS